MIHLAEERIERQRYDGECAHAAVINACRLCGGLPLSAEHVAECFQTLAEFRDGNTVKFGERDAPLPIDTLTILTTCGLVALMGIIPPRLHHDPRPLICAHLAAGRPVLLSFIWRDGSMGELVHHIVVAEGYTPDGYIVLDGSPGIAGGRFTTEGARIDLEPAAMSADEIETLRPEYEQRTHGARSLLPWSEVVIPGDGRVGLTATYIVVSGAG